MTIERKLQNIVDSKEQIKSAIENKGVTVGNAPLSQYADKIEEIETGINVSDGLVFTNPEKTEATLYISDGVIPDFMINKTMDIYGIFDIVDIPITNLIIEGSVTYIGNYALVGVKVDQPFFSVNNIQSLGNSPFSYSSFPNEDLIVKANWANKSNLFKSTTFNSITFDDDVTEIAESLFENAIIVSNIPLQLPPNLIIINKYAFDNLDTPSTFDLVIPDSVQIIKFNPFESSKVARLIAGPNIIKDAYNEPNKYTNFANMPELLEAKVTSGLVYERTFLNCPKMHTCEIGSPGNPVTEIINSCFGDCTALTSLIIYCDNPANPPAGAPYGAQNGNLVIEYRQA